MNLYLTNRYRSIAQQESRALRLLYNAHGHYPNTKPANINEDLDINQLCPEQNEKGIYKHRRNKEPNCPSCADYKTRKDRKRRPTKSERAQTTLGK